MRAPYLHTPSRSNLNSLAVAISTLVCVGKDCEPLGRVAGTEHPKEKGCGVHFVHYTGIESEGYRSFEEGERVSYEPIRGRKGERASACTRSSRYGAVLALLHPSAEKGRYAKLVSDLSYNAVAVGEKRALACRESRGSSQQLRSVHKDSSCRIPQLLTPLLTPLRTQHAETAGNRQQRKRLR